MTYFTVICPYVFETEVVELRNFLGFEIDSIFEEDTNKIGSDLMYQKLWNQCDTDIFIMHADMMPIDDDWVAQIEKYVEEYPEAGLFGCKLLYPAEKEKSKRRIIQSAGGRFVNNKPDHYGSGLDLFTGSIFKKLEEDSGQYDCVREVAWTTFGGVYIRRQVIDDVGDYDPAFEWAYNRDVDYCLSARKHGWKIYQIPVAITHFESKDNKRIRSQNPSLNQIENRNLTRLQEKWKDSSLFKTIENNVAR